MGRGSNRAHRTRLTSDPNPPVLYEGSRLLLSCEAPVESGLSYTWYFNRSVVTPQTAPPLRPVGGRLVVERVTEQHAGRYSCVITARRTNNRTFSSRELTVVVKAFLSQPRISFSFSQAAGGYEGAVTCWTSTGSPPASFSLSLDGEEVASHNATASMTVTFPVAMEPAQDMGAARCRVKTDVQDLWSETQPLVVVPVGGHVELEVEYLYGADSKMAAAQLHCRPSRGTFPSFSWLLNGAGLPADLLPAPPLHDAAPRYGLVDGGRSLVLTGVAPGGGGSYRCRVRDSFNDSAPWFESPAVLVRLTAAALTTIEIISISFCCFLLLVLVAGGVFVMLRLGDRRRATSRRASTTHSGPRLPAALPSLTAQRTRAGVGYDAHRQTLQLIPVQ
ncbi:hemicentin-2 isoform X3 [Gadus morhua]|uniref:hemicentin-2 isoform X3 n=1 Tax=Gadus morhua TaxID=8049 RepID=UPI0011B5BC89|nr:hemicentin-2-like isoform X3 [Gadus morhua]